MEKRVIRLDECELKEVIKNSMIKVLKEHQYGDLSLDSNPNLIVKFVGKNEIMPISDFLWKMLTESYENIGGLKTYRSYEDFLRKIRYAKLAYDGDEIVACAIYRRMEDSYKMVAIGCNQEEIGKEGIQAIIKDDIEKFDFHFWAEVSGAIEHYFKKYNGYPMPNTLASDILNIPSDLIRLSSNDKVHYERQIANEWYRKMIFGAKSKEIYEAALAAVDDYSTFIKEVNNIREETNYGCKYSLKQALYIVENIYRAHEEDNFNELVPSWYEALQEAMKTLKMQEPSETVLEYIDYCEYLFDNMPLLELHPLEL